MASPPPMPWQIPVRLVAGVLVINLLVVGGAASWLYQSRLQYEERAQISARNLATVLETSIRSFFREIDLTLQTVADEVAREIAAGGIDRQTLEAFLRRHDERLPGTLGLRVTNAHGIIEYAVSGVATRQVDMSDRKHFAIVRDDPSPKMVFEGPFLGRVSGQWVITLAHRINAPDGGFAGEVHVSVPADHFNRMLSTLEVGPHGVISLRNDAAELIAGLFREVQGGVPAAGSKLVSPLFRRLVAEGLTEKNYYSPTSGADGAPRTVSFRKLSPYPLYVVVAQAERDYLAEWYGQCLLAVLIVVAFCLLTVLSSWLEYRSWRRRLATAQDLAEQAAEYSRAMGEAKEAAESARQRAEAILASAGQGIYGVDADGNTMFINEAAMGMLGWTSEEVLGRNQHALFHHSRADGTPYPEPECPILKTIRDNERHHVRDEVFWRKDGSSFPVEYISAPIVDGGVVTGAVLAFHDVSDHLARESALRQARETADEANRMKSRFLATMSHEIRTPITGVMGMVDLLGRTPLSEEQESYVRTLGTSTQTLLTVLNDILDISKIEAGKLALEATGFDLPATVEAVVQLSLGAASAKGLALALECAREVPRRVTGDPARLKQVLYNLISNAVKFTEAGSVAVAVTVVARTPSAVRVAIEVRDTGIGMTPEQMGRLFQPFSQGDASTARRFGGTGLGLAISKRLVEMMGGRIEAKSRAGRGSRFRVVLPFPLAEAPAPAPERPRGSAGRGEGGRSLGILLAEDNAINQMLITAMLTKVGHRVDVVENGRQAVAAVAVAATAFDAVLMDMQMPEMTGEEAAQAIRALPPPANGVPILALTADVMTGHRARYLQAGVNDLVAKPIDWDILFRALDEVVAPRGEERRDESGKGDADAN